MSTDQMIEILQAHKDGKIVEWKYKQTPDDLPSAWTPTTAFNFIAFDYRVKPEPPKPREWWIETHACFYGSTDGISSQSATLHSGNKSIYGHPVIHVREVLEES